MGCSIFQKELSKKKKKKKEKKIEFPLMTSSNVHEWKGKPRSIIWFQCLMQQIIKNKDDRV